MVIKDAYPHDEKSISGCGLSGFMHQDGKRVGGEDIIQSIALLHDRSNGLGGGFAAYGIYPEHKDEYALHLMYDDSEAKKQTESLIDEQFQVSLGEEIPTRLVPGIQDPPLFRRYFVHTRPDCMAPGENENDYVVRQIMRINDNISGAFVVSSGRNMGAFKGVGYAEDIGHFFRLEEYEAYTWIAHGRFPTNTQGWWGGAHPFTILDWAVVHNGEISSYGINKRYLETFGYRCTMRTDTEVMAYILDLLLRRHRVPLKIACKVMSAPFWKDIEHMDPEEHKIYKAVRMVYGSMLANGPFAIIFGRRGQMVAINDRVKLRPLVAGRKGDTIYVSSEEAGIREICKDLDEVWTPRAGDPVVAQLEDEVLM